MTEQRVHLARSARVAYDALEKFSATVAEVATSSGIDDRLKELVMLRCSQLNGCAFCVRVHTNRATRAGVDVDTLTQITTWRDSGVFSDRERAGLELAEAFTFIHSDGIPDELYHRIGSILSEPEYVGLSWLAVSINAFNRVAIAGRYPVPPLEEAR